MTHRSDLIPSEWVAITPSDSAQLGLCALMVTVTGDVSWKSLSSSATTVFPSAPVGMIIPGPVAQVMAATTATVLGGKP